MVGSRDGLIDQSKLFSTRLKKLGKQIGLKIYKGLPHAFMNFDFPISGL